MKNSLIFLILVYTTASAQCFIKKTNNTLVLKWYTLPLISPQGCRIITPDSIYVIKPYQTTIPKQYNTFIAISQSSNELNNLSGLSLLIETFKSAELATHLGIQTQVHDQYTISSLTLICQNKNIIEKIVLPDFTAPPTKLSYTPNASQILIQWHKSSPDQVGHLIYYKNHDTIKCLTNQPVFDTAYYTSKVTEGAFSIKSINVFGDTSSFSHWLIIQSPLSAPHFIKAVQMNTTIRVSWPHSTYTQYHLVRYSRTDTVEFTNIHGSDTSMFDVPKSYGIYTYKLFGETSTGQFSDTIQTQVEFKDLTPPDTPLQLGYHIDGTVTTLTWQPCQASDLKGYLVYRVLLDSMGTKIKQLSVPLLVNSFTMHTTPSSKWCISAIDHASNASPCSAVLSITHTLSEMPETPLITSLSKNGHSWYLKWLPATHASHYRIWQCKIDSMPTEAKILIKIPATLHQWRIHTTNLHGLYRYWIEAINSQGIVSLPSNGVSQRFLKETIK